MKSISKIFSKKIRLNIHSSLTYKSQNLEVLSPSDKNDRGILHEILRNLSDQFDSETV